MLPGLDPSRRRIRRAGAAACHGRCPGRPKPPALRRLTRSLGLSVPGATASLWPGCVMDLVSAIEMTAGAIGRVEDRKERLSLYLLATKLHDLYIPPNEAASVIGAMVKDELKPSELQAVYERVVRNSAEINRLLGQLDLLCKTRGRTLFTPSELATVSQAIDRKRGLRVDMLDIFRAYRVRQYAVYYPYIAPSEEEGRQWDLPAYTPDTVSKIKADTRVLDEARTLQQRIERLSVVLDAAFETLTAPVARFPPRRLGTVQIALIITAGAVLWILGAVSSKLTEPLISRLADWVRQVLATWLG